MAAPLTRPNTAAAAASSNDSPRISCTTRFFVHPSARRAPISVRRSKTLIAIVFNTPNAPIRAAIADVSQAIVRVTRIWVSELTN